MPAENSGSADFCRLVAGFDWAFSLSGPVQKRAVGAGVRLRLDGGFRRPVCPDGRVAEVAAADKV